MSDGDHMDRHRSGSSQRPWRLLVPILALGFACRVAVVLAGDFVYHPDVVSQYLEPAWRMVSGYGLVFWDRYYGARPQIVPGALAVAMQTLLTLGVEHPTTLRTWIEVVLCGVSLLVPWGMYALARAAFDERTARVALVLGVAWYEFVALAGQALSELLALGPLVWMFAMAVGPRSSRRATALAVLLIATCALRFQYAPLALVAGILAMPALAGAGLRARFVATAALCLVLLAVFDMATVGAPLFRSYVANLVFNLVFVEEVVAVGADTPWKAYPQALLLASGGLVLVGVTGVLPQPSSAARLAYVKWLLVPITLLLVTHFASPWKEYRFILAAVPFWLVGLATVLATLWPRKGAGRRAAGFLAMWFALASVLGLLLQLPGQSGVHVPSHRASRAFVGQSDPNLALARELVEDSTLTGLAEVAIDPGTGLGQVHLGRDVPIYDGHTVAALEECGHGPGEYASHAMVPPGVSVPAGFPVELAEVRGWRLVAAGPTGQAADPPPPSLQLTLFPVSLTGFYGRIARRVFEAESAGGSWPVRLWASWRGDSYDRNPLVSLSRVAPPGRPLRVALPPECSDSARRGDRMAGG